MGALTNISFGLLGHPLGHSWSPQIHAQLGAYRYDLVDLDEDSARAFLLGNGWQGLNVTIPYKRMAAELADQRSHRVDRLGVANTLVRQQDGTVFAENTDVLGFAWMLDRFCQSKLGGTPREVLGAGEALVLGTGGAAQAVRAALEDSAGCTVSLISRRGDDTYENLVERHPHARLVVNATPVGMYPNCPESPLSTEVLSGLLELRGVLDVVYNPERTGLCLAAEQLGLASESGLAMLVAQAHFASELFQGKRLDDSKVGQIEDAIRHSQRNIVLIGMPGAGKTSTGRILARSLSRPFIDLDDAFDMEVGCSPEVFIRNHGEEEFRKHESEVAKLYGARSGLVIACGGGIVTRERNYANLHQNGTIAFIDRPLYQLTSAGRPISQLKGIERLANERMGLYESWADVRISCTGSAAGDAALLRSRLGL